MKAKLLALDAFMDSLIDHKEASDKDANVSSNATTTVDDMTSPATNRADQIVLDMQIEDEQEQAAVRIQAACRGRLGRKRSGA